MAKHGWRIIRQPNLAPQKCAVFPHIGPASGHLFVDTGTEIMSARRDPHIYISEPAVRELAAMFDMVPAGSVRAAEAQRDEMQVELMLAEARAEALERQLEQVKSTIELVK